MDRAYYEAPVGSPEHYAAYGKEFAETGGVCFPVPVSAADSYEVDNAAELAYDRWLNDMGAVEPEDREPEDPAPAPGPDGEAEPPW
jgi:hypothetical protein